MELRTLSAPVKYTLCKAWEQSSDSSWRWNVYDYSGDMKEMLESGSAAANLRAPAAAEAALFSGLTTGCWTALWPRKVSWTRLFFYHILLTHFLHWKKKQNNISASPPGPALTVPPTPTNQPRKAGSVLEHSPRSGSGCSHGGEERTERPEVSGGGWNLSR